MNDRLTLFAEKSPDALAVLAADGRILYGNRSFQVLFGDAGEGGFSSIYDLELPVDLKYELQRVIESVTGGCEEESFQCEFEADGEPGIYGCRVIPCPGSSGQEILVEMRDETDLTKLKNELSAGRMSRRQEDLLKERRRRLFYGLLNDLPTFVYLQRKDYTVAFANRKVRKLYGESEGRLCYEVFAGRSSPCPVCPTFEVFETGQSVEWEFTDNDGRTFLIYDYPYEDETGEPLVLEMGVDITELKDVEKELFQAQKLRAIGVLAGGIAHDLNNNLVPIIFNIEYARDKVDDPAVEEPLEEALQAANRAASLVAQVLEYSRQQEVSRTPVRLAPIVRECIREVETNLQGDISFHTDLELGADIVFGNDVQIRQVVMNLLRNAEQSMPEGGVISLSMQETVLSEKRKNGMKDLAPGKYLIFEVADTGVGIRAENLERIFEPFFTSKKGMGGTGMGLAVVHSIITGSGGNISVESTPGIGSTFTVFFPGGEESHDILVGELCVLEGDSKNILLVDDDPGPQAAMARALRQAGFVVDTAGSGEEGLELFSSDPDRYSMVLADQSMPGMTGIEMAVKMLAEKKDMRIVICTGHTEPALEEQARKEGISGFARKPMSPKKLTEVVRRHCSYG